MAYVKRTFQTTPAVKWAEAEPFIVEGTYKGIISEFDTKTHHAIIHGVQLDKGDKYPKNAVDKSGVIGLFETPYIKTALSEGDIGKKVKIEFKGSTKIKTGKWAGKNTWDIEVLVDEESGDDAFGGLYANN